jgi:hypothetical protein
VNCQNKQLWCCAEAGLPLGLLLKDQRRSDACCLEGDSDVHTIGNGYKLNSTTQPIIIAVDRQYPFDLSGGPSLISINGER